MFRTGYRKAKLVSVRCGSLDESKKGSESGRRCEREGKDSKETPKLWPEQSAKISWGREAGRSLLDALSLKCLLVKWRGPIGSWIYLSELWEVKQLYPPDLHFVCFSLF